jgi:hypothetical protein
MDDFLRDLSVYTYLRVVRSAQLALHDLAPFLNVLPLPQAARRTMRKRKINL